MKMLTIPRMFRSARTPDEAAIPAEKGRFRLRVGRRAKFLTTVVAATCVGVLVGGAAVNAAIQRFVGSSVMGHVIVTEDVASSHTSTSWTTIANENIFANITSTVLVRFSAETLCTGGSWCSVRILVNDDEAFPRAGTDFAFDSPSDNWESHSVERAYPTNCSSVSCNVKVQVAALGGSTFRLDDWTLSIWALRGPS
ncbi:hypothetical protein Aph01nite_17530 [Acrocarpospora phusangensis]|uniref:Uncharacterized protein n=1 Tax=Acrocarpospora phusangensis TaxID=1070424 RepID=A0A919Q9R1_9ACTN|nr:hypothetical protein [Acrocarpospora phusangensis]GIH23443.1 hypothetical protein Aph01nite_17530 [Acrocarpospora phusangensis]